MDALDASDTGSVGLGSERIRASMELNKIQARRAVAELAYRKEWHRQRGMADGRRLADAVIAGATIREAQAVRETKLSERNKRRARTERANARLLARKRESLGLELEELRRSKEQAETTYRHMRRAMTSEMYAARASKDDTLLRSITQYPRELSLSEQQQASSRREKKQQKQQERERMTAWRCRVTRRQQADRVAGFLAATTIESALQAVDKYRAEVQSGHRRARAVFADILDTALDEAVAVVHTDEEQGGDTKTEKHVHFDTSDHQDEPQGKAEGGRRGRERTWVCHVQATATSTFSGAGGLIRRRQAAETLSGSERLESYRCSLAARRERGTLLRGRITWEAEQKAMAPTGMPPAIIASITGTKRRGWRSAAVSSTPPTLASPSSRLPGSRPHRGGGGKGGSGARQ